jgi:hypothetical protein
MKLISIYEDLIREATLPQLKQKYVGEEGEKVQVKVKGGGRRDFDKISEKTFDKIANLQMTIGKRKQQIKPNYVEWIVKQVAMGNLMEEDIYKYGDQGDSLGFISELLNNKVNRYLSVKDLNQYAKSKDFEVAIIDAIDNKQKDEEEVADATGKDAYVDSIGIKELKGEKIEFLGKVAGYQAFKVPKGNTSKAAYKVYVKHLAKCHGRKISLCTIADYSSFKKYVSKDDLYVFFNQDDQYSPYQFSYG